MYRDIDLSFEKSANKDIKVIEDYVSIQQSIDNLIGLEFHDIPYNDSITSTIKELLFESGDGQITSSVVISHLSWLLNEYEPRIKDVDISVDYYDDSGTSTAMVITIKYVVVKTNQIDKMVYSKSSSNSS